MKKISLLLLLTTFMVGTSYAGGSIFGGSKRRSSNPDGVSSVGMKICNSLNCPDVIIKQGDCGDIEHAIQQYGVCVCEEGYQALNGVCLPTGESSCQSGIVKVYNCETKTTTDCCPDSEACEQPTDCGCLSNDDCPGQQICDNGTCSCPKDDEGNVGTLGADGETCCFDTHKWTNKYGDPGAYVLIQGDVCGCAGTYGGDGYCCDPSTGHAQPPGVHFGEFEVDIEHCNCGNDGRPSADKTVCCRSDNVVTPLGTSWEHYVDIDQCGCPDNKELVDGVCCDGVYSWNFDDWEYNIGDEKCGFVFDNGGEDSPDSPEPTITMTDEICTGLWLCEEKWAIMFNGCAFCPSGCMSIIRSFSDDSFPVACRILSDCDTMCKTYTGCVGGTLSGSVCKCNCIESY